LNCRESLIPRNAKVKPKSIKMKYEDLLVTTLGKGGVVSPLKIQQREDSPVYKFVDDSERILYEVSLESYVRCKETGGNPSRLKGRLKENIFLNLPRPRWAL
jgi:hypothetical protein